MHRMIQILTVIAIALICTLSACQTTVVPGQSTNPVVTIPPPAATSGVRDTHEGLDSLLWMQTSVEYQIACQKVFESARKAQDQALLFPNWTAALEQNGSYQSLPPAIILDVDDTVLDNTLFYGRLVKDHLGYDFSLWKEWVAMAKALPIPGAADFVFYAASKGVEIFYVTNRDADMEAATRLNLSRLDANFPIGVDTVLMNGEKPGWTSDKSSRRAFVAENYRILLLMGDDLGDFVTGAKDTLEIRATLTAKYHTQWGRYWFLIPNPLSGSWESVLYGYNPSISDSEILAKKFAAVKYFGESTATAAESQTPIVVPDANVTFTGDKCLYDGPDKVYSGKLTISMEIKEKGFPSYGLFLATMDPGKNMQDLVNWQSLDQPPWVHAVASKIVTPGYPTTMATIVSEGPLYLICFGFEPDTVIGRWGPIELKK